MIVAGVLLGTICWLLVFRLKDRFIRAYGAFFLVLLFFVVNKGSLAETSFFSTDISSPMSLLRWLTLGILVVVSLRARRPQAMRTDVMSGAIVGVFLLDILVSTTYAEDKSYALMRALSFVLMAVAIMIGFVFYLYWRANCLSFIRLHYYTALCLLPTAMILYLTGLSQYGAGVLMSQYAGPFSNQNLFGIFSALITPYVLFHWKMEATKRWQWWLDAGLLAVIFSGVWLSNSRGGLLSTLIAVASYFFTVNLESRLKIFALVFCAIVIFAVFPKLQSTVTSFIRKDTVQRAEVKNVGEQLVEERRYGMWTGVLPLYWKEKMTGYGFASSHLLTFAFTTDKEAGRHVHNSYLELFGDLGLPGILLLLLILYRVAAHGLTLLHRRDYELQRNINAVFISIFAAGAVNAFFESWMFSVGNLISLIFWGPLAGIVAQWVGRERNVIEPELVMGLKGDYASGGLRPQLGHE
ncbi:MAG: O-antigen ligase family protein [Acidobacteria bacterium]|nr:O-antigen ligase family protein [Acidobacteriota bacterium]MBI3428052.1 O-antigen ligase family protein [Acidobacteriota bacterium]